jgi:N-acetylneuraminic acid mutarotase
VANRTHGHQSRKKARKDRPMTLRYLALASLVLLTGCGGGGGGSTQHAPSSPFSAAVAGAVQKGPFLVGSTVSVNKLDSLGHLTNSTIETEIKDSIGSFSFAPDSAGPVQIVANGYYFNELTGQKSAGTLTLKGIYEVGAASQQTAYVNIMTHLINARVLALIGRGTTVTNAIAQAQQEFLQTFSPALPPQNVGQFSALSVYNTGGTSDTGNTYLLALSTGFYQYAATMAQNSSMSSDAELASILTQLSDDLASDGQLQTPFMSDFIKAIRSLRATEIAENLRRRSLPDHPAGLDVPDISRLFRQCAVAAECTWRSGAALPLPSSRHATVAFGGKLYVFGGETTAEFGSKPALPPGAYQYARVYDPVANNWTALQPMPIGLDDLEAHTIGDKIYVVAGHGVAGVRNELMEYDPLADSWTMKTPSPAYRSGFASAVVNGRIYVMGGRGMGDDGPEEAGEPSVFKDRVAIYDTATDSWSEGQAMPMAYEPGASCVLSDRIYVFGGFSILGAAPDTWEYNTTSNSWSAKSSVNGGRGGLDCVRVGDQFYLLGGYNAIISTLDFVDRYDPATDTWSSPTRMPAARADFDADAVGGEIFIIGGLDWQQEPLDGVAMLNPIL